MVGDGLTAAIFDVGGVLVDWNSRHLDRRLFDDGAAMEGLIKRDLFAALEPRAGCGRTVRGGPRPNLGGLSASHGFDRRAWPLLNMFLVHDGKPR